MLLKWIVCTVPEEKRDAFDAAQRAWTRIRYLDGLVVQVGGFDVASPDSACILGFWRDDASYGRFMQNVHDAVTSESGQGDHCESIDVGVYEVVSRMPGQRPRLLEAMAAGRVLRVAACRVKAEATHHFVRAQLDVWTPGMASAKGMLGGVFARKQDESNEYLVVTSWEDEELHQLYVDHHLPELRRRAAAEEDLKSLSGRQIAMERHWKVLGIG
jgi:heme-degrading monooxygenase HmoA